MDRCKLEIFIPETHLRLLQKALQEADAGHIGNYDSCLSYGNVIGIWRPLDGAQAYLGKNNELSQEKEIKVETVCKRENLAETVASIKKNSSL